MDNDELENLKNQLISSLNTLSQQENRLSSIEMNTAENIESEILFKNRIDDVKKSLDNVPNIINNTNRQIKFIFSSSQDISWRINMVDVAYSRCRDVSLRVKHLNNLSDSLSNFDEIYSKGDYKGCAENVSKLVNIPHDLLTPDDIHKIDSKRGLTLDLLKREYESGRIDIISLFEYYQKCNAEAEGIKEFANKHHALIVDETNPNYIKLNKLTPSNWNDKGYSPHIESLVFLLNSIANHIHEAIATLADPGLIAIFIQTLLNLCDNKIESLIRLYAEYRGIVISQVKMEIHKPVDDCENTTFLNIVSEEIAIISHEFNTWSNFVKNKSKEGIETDLYKRSNFSTKGAFKSHRAVQELLASYMGLSTKYLNLIGEKLVTDIVSFENNDVVNDGIDDLFYVFRTIISRSLKTNATTTLSTIFNIMISYINDLTNRLLEDDNNTSKPESYLIVLNAVETTSVYLSKLVSFVEGMILSKFSGDDFKILEHSLTDFNEITKKLETKRKRNINEIVAVEKANIDQMMLIFLREEWTNELETTLTIDIETSLRGKFAEFYNRFKEKYQKIVNQSNFQLLNQIFLNSYAKQFTALLFKKKFDKKGAYLLSLLINFFKTETGSEESFHRLTEISFILNLQKPKDLDACINNNMKFSLTNEGIMRVIKLRIDWKDENLSFLY